MKTVSTKLDKRDHNKLMEMCNFRGQTVAESLREMIQDEIEFCNNCQGLDEETLDEYRSIRKKIGSHDEGGITMNDDGTPKDVNFIWLTDEEKRELGNGERIAIKEKPNPTETNNKKSNEVAQATVTLL